MTLSNEEIERIAELIFKKILDKQAALEKESEHIYHIYDDVGNVSVVNELAFLQVELDRCNELKDKYVNEEQFEKAMLLKDKIAELELKIKNIK